MSDKDQITRKEMKEGQVKKKREDKEEFKETREKVNLDVQIDRFLIIVVLVLFFFELTYIKMRAIYGMLRGRLKIQLEI